MNSSNTRQDAIAVIKAARDERMNECLGGIQRKSSPDCAQLTQLVETASRESSDVWSKRQLTIQHNAKQCDLVRQFYTDTI
jgi:hypothetical protein